MSHRNYGTALVGGNTIKDYYLCFIVLEERTRIWDIRMFRDSLPNKVMLIVSFALNKFQMGISWMGFYLNR